MPAPLGRCMPLQPIRKSRSRKGTAFLSRALRLSTHPIDLNSGALALPHQLQSANLREPAIWRYIE